MQLEELRIGQHHQVSRNLDERMACLRQEMDQKNTKLMKAPFLLPYDDRHFWVFSLMA